MIDSKELTAIGTVLKTHGISGELNVLTDVPDTDFAGFSCVFFDCDGLKVPFFIRSYRRRSAGSVLISLEEVGAQQQAATFAGKDVLVKNSELADNDEYDDAGGFYLSDLEDFAVKTEGRVLGVIEDFDDSTENVLLLVRTPDGHLVHIPAVDEFFLSVDTDTCIVDMSLPDGLLEL